MRRKIVVIFLTVSVFISTSASHALAEDLPIINILKNGLYGGVVGGLLGSASLAFTEKPSDNLDFIGKGVAYGVFAGTIFGVYQLKDYFVSIDDNGVNFALPAIKIEQSGNNKEDRENMEYHVGVLQYKF